MVPVRVRVCVSGGARFYCGVHVRVHVCIHVRTHVCVRGGASLASLRSARSAFPDAGFKLCAANTYHIALLAILKDVERRPKDVLKDAENPGAIPERRELIFKKT